MRTIILSMTILFLLPGCIFSGKVAMTPRANHLAARDTFNATVHGLAALREAGAFTKAEAEHVTMMIRLGQETLDRWEAAIELKQPSESFMQDMNYIVRELVSRRIAAARRERSRTERKTKDGT